MRRAIRNGGMAMKQVLIGMVSAWAVLATGAAEAAGAVIGRAGLTAGTYEFEAGSFRTDSNAYGVQLGFGGSFGRIFLDWGMDYQHVANDFLDRTDYLFTGGVFIGDRWSVFGGYRYGNFGDDFTATSTDSNYYLARGPYAGGSFSQRIGSAVALNLALAYNFVEYSDPDGTSLDISADGVSGKLQANLLGTPHAIYLRAQAFNGEDDANTFKFKESFVQLGYAFTFDLLSW